MDCETARTIYRLSLAIERYENTREKLLAGESVPGVELGADRGKLCFDGGLLTATGSWLSSDLGCTDVSALRKRWQVKIARVEIYKAYGDYSGLVETGLSVAELVVPGSASVIDMVEAGMDAAGVAVRPNLFEPEDMLYHGVDLGVIVLGASTGVGAPLAIGYGFWKWLSKKYLRDNQCTI